MFRTRKRGRKKRSKLEVLESTVVTFGETKYKKMEDLSNKEIETRSRRSQMKRFIRR